MLDRRKRVNFKWTRPIQFQGMDLDSNYVRVEGIYAMGERGKIRTILVGQGNIREKLLRPGLPGSIRLVDVLVSWVVVPNPRTRDGIERYLNEVLNPLVKTELPDCQPIGVNWPPAWI